MRTYLPFLCRNAKKVRGLYEQQMTLFIFSFILKSEKFNENASFELKDWEVFLDEMNKYMLQTEKADDNSRKISY